MAAAWGLALHTAGKELGLALGTDPTDLRWQTWDLDRELSTQLHVKLSAFLPPQTWGDLAFVAVVLGPGSFTSTRVGVACARTLAQQLEVPLFGISTLAAAAEVARLQGRRGCVAALMPARRQQIFGAVYSFLEDKLAVQMADATFSPADWAVVRGSMMDSTDLEISEPVGSDVVGAFALAYTAWQAGERPYWSEVVPFYGQNPIDISR